MFIYSVKAQKIKFWAAMTASAVIISTVIAVTPIKRDRYPYADGIEASAQTLTPSDFKNVKTN